MVAFALVAAMFTLAGIVSIVEGLLGRRGIRIQVLVVRRHLSVADQAQRWLETQV